MAAATAGTRRELAMTEREGNATDRSATQLIGSWRRMRHCRRHHLLYLVSVRAHHMTVARGGGGGGGGRVRPPMPVGYAVGGGGALGGSVVRGDGRITQRCGTSTLPRSLGPPLLPPRLAITRHSLSAARLQPAALFGELLTVAP